MGNSMGNSGSKSESTLIGTASDDSAVCDGQLFVLGELGDEQGTPLGDPPTSETLRTILPSHSFYVGRIAWMMKSKTAASPTGVALSSANGST